MATRRFEASVDGDLLCWRLTPDQLGVTPARVWNPSPTTTHRTEPWDLPKTLVIGIKGNEDTAARYSPPPFAVGIESPEGNVLVAVRADAGCHAWNDVTFITDSEGITITIDLEGHTDPASLLGRVQAVVIAGKSDESFMTLLGRGLRETYPETPVRSPGDAPAWWRRPIYCGWGDQVTMSMWLEGLGPERRALPYCTQGLHERWIRRLEEADVPVGTVIIDHGWSPAGSWQPNLERWPDLRGFIDRQHQAGRKVLLWIATWLWDGLPDEWCVFADDWKICADPTHEGYRQYVREQVHHLLSPDGLDADGFKIDQLAYSPNQRRPRGGARFGWTRFGEPPAKPIRLANPGVWGTELLHQYQKDIYQAAKRAKPDCLVTSSTIHPYFHDSFDMARLHDTGVIVGDVFESMKVRADLAEAALPGIPIDTDDWVHSDYDLWMRYTSGSHVLGVPCIFYAEHFMLNWNQEPATRLIPIDDLRRIGEAWRQALPC